MRLFITAGWLSVLASVITAQAASPEIQSLAPIEYPRLALLGGKQGRVVIQVRVDGGGRAVAIKLLHNNIPYSETIEHSVKKWLFSSCKTSAMDCTMHVEFIFTLDKERCKENECDT